MRRFRAGERSGTYDKRQPWRKGRRGAWGECHLGRRPGFQLWGFWEGRAGRNDFEATTMEIKGMRM